MKIFPALCTALLLLVGHGSALACTVEEATAKAEQVAARITEITQRDPQRAARLREEFQDQKPKTSSQALETDCQVYDQRLLELEQAAEEMEPAKD
ncbi:MAG: hypothetical protein V4812_12980 [Pseudomonadota bacterium]